MYERNIEVWGVVQTVSDTNLEVWGIGRKDPEDEEYRVVEEPVCTHELW